MNDMNVLVACEYSGTVRDAFIAKGHHAVSCDILPTERPGPHYLGDVREVLYSRKWDLLIGHPPCTHLSKAGAWCWKNKAIAQAEAFDFVMDLWNAPIQFIAIENPVGWMNTNWRKPSQIIQPWMFGDPWLKETCLWLKGLPSLLPTDIVTPVGNWVKPGNNRPHRRFNDVPEGGGGTWKGRSKTFQGIANAMAEQWSNPIIKQPASQSSLFEQA